MVPHDAVKPGTVGMNTIQRKYLQVSLDDEKPVHKFLPPSKRFEAVIFSFTIEFVKAGKKTSIDAKNLAGDILMRFCNQVFQVGFARRQNYFLKRV